MLALEAGEPQEIVSNDEINLYLQGRKEQAMRQIHFDEVGYKQVSLSDVELKTPLKMAERKYNLSIIPINDNDLANRIDNDLKAQKVTFDELAAEFSMALEKEIGLLKTFFGDGLVIVLGKQGEGVA